MGSNRTFIQTLYRRAVAAMRMASMRTSSGRTERGASLVEYALLLGLIALVCITAVTFLGTQTSSSLGNSGTRLFP